MSHFPDLRHHTATPAQRRATATSGFAGAALWAAGTVGFMAAHLIVQNAWTQPYSWVINNISDLGHVTCSIFEGRDICSPLHTLFNVGFVLTGLLITAGVLLTTRCWGTRKTATTARILLGLAGVGYVMAGLNPADVNLDLHVAAALMILIGGNAALLVAGFMSPDALLGRLRPISRFLAIIGLGGALLHLAGLTGWLGLGGMERMAAFPLLIWLLCAAVAITGVRRPPPRRGADVTGRQSAARH